MMSRVSSKRISTYTSIFEVASKTGSLLPLGCGACEDIKGMQGVTFVTANLLHDRPLWAQRL